MPTASSNLFDRLTLALMVAILVVPITYLEVAHPSWSQVWTDAHRMTNHFPHASTTGSSAVPATSTKVNSEPATNAAQPAPQAKTATTNSYVHLRADKSVNSDILANIASGTAVQLTSSGDPTWQGVTYQGKNGYIYRAYLTY